MKALASGVEVVPVWNKSNREHTIIGSEPASVRQAADAAVKALGWKLPYFCDADHITLQTAGRFLDSCDFYTIDVADFIGKAAPARDIDNFVKRRPELLGRIQLQGTASIPDYAGKPEADRAEVSDRREKSRRGLPHDRKSQGQGELHPRGVHG